MFFILSLKLSYYSSVQLKNFFTRQLLSASLSDSYYSDSPKIYTKIRPVDENGKFWTIEPDEENISLYRHSIKCDSIITLYNSETESYLSAIEKDDKVDVKLVPQRNSVTEKWKISCETEHLEKSQRFMLYNIKHRCYLNTFFDELEEDVGLFKVWCGEMNHTSVWKTSCGVYFKEDEPDNNNSHSSEL